MNAIGILSCNACRCAAVQNIQSLTGINGLSQLASTMTQLFVIVNSLAENVAALANKVGQLSTTQSLTPSSGNLQRGSLYAEMKEFSEREKRRQFLVFRGTGVSNVPDFNSVFNDVCAELNVSDASPESVHCINADTGMFRVKVANGDKRKELLQNSASLKDSENMKHVYVSRDLTYIQRQERRTFRTSRRAAPNGESTSPPVSGANAIPLSPLIMQSQALTNVTPNSTSASSTVPLPVPGTGQPQNL